MGHAHGARANSAADRNHRNRPVISLALWISVTAAAVATVLAAPIESWSAAAPVDALSAAPLAPLALPPLPRFLVGFRRYALAEEHTATLQRLWSAWADDSGSCAAWNTSREVCATLSDAADSPLPLSWHVLTRDNPAALLPTDFIVIEFEQPAADPTRPDDDAQWRAALRNHSPKLKQRAHRQLAGLCEQHPLVLKYAQEDVRVSRTLMQSDTAAPLSPAEEEERRRMQSELDGIMKRIDEAEASAASPSTPRRGGVGDFRPPQRFDLARGVSAVTAAEAAHPATSSPTVPMDLSALRTSGASLRRRLCAFSGGFGNSVTDLLQASKLWSAGHTGRGIHIAIFDTGLSKTHAHFRNVEERTNWTDEKTLEDGLGHGTFVAGVIASAADCLGFAPDASLHIFRVFNQRQLSFTSWFLDAFNYAIHSKVHVLNLSIGGPDFLDRPFVDKVNEMSANGITVVSAIGNDGPLWGTLNNPADQMDVIGVGGINEDDRISAFSSRGMTTWELPSGYGRMKPDIVALARNIRGSNQGGGCKTMSGTSVASPVVAGCVTLLASVVPEAERASKLNPAFLKQLLLESAVRVGSPKDAPGIFEQGEGKISLTAAYALLTHGFAPHASIVPSQLDLVDCPYMWPYCTQALYHTAQAIIVNTTVLNSQAVSSFVPTDAPPRFYLDLPGADSDVLHVWFTYPESFWPWSGYFAIHLAVRHDVSAEQLVSGFVVVTLQSDDEFSVRSVIKLPLRVRVVPTPPRANRLLFDAFHNLRYPSGYFPRDNLEVKSDTLDWNGDHVHTNYRELYAVLRDAGYFVEVLGRDYTCFNASLYGALVLIDPEEEYFVEELSKLWDDVYLDGLNLLVLADWYNVQVMREIKFYDENTAEWWTPETGGANLPALNSLLAGFGMQLSDHVVKGEIRVNEETIYYASGSTIAKFPQGGHLSSHRVSDGGSASPARDYALLGAYSPAASDSPLSSAYPSAGRVVLFGDSNCVDMNHRRGNLCSRLVLESLAYLSSGVVNPRVFGVAQSRVPFVDSGVSKKPRRVIGNNLAKYSRVIGPGSRPQCPLTEDADAPPKPTAASASASPSSPSYADQHAALALAALSADDSTKADSRFHSAVQLISKKSKLQRSRQKQQEHAAEALADEHEQHTANDVSSSPSLDRGHVLSKHASFPQGDELALAHALPPSASPASSLFPSPRWSSAMVDRSGDGSVTAQRERRQRWLKLGLVCVMVAILCIAWIARKQKHERDRQAKLREEDDGTASNGAHSKPAQPTSRASGAVPQQRTTAL